MEELGEVTPLTTDPPPVLEGTAAAMFAAFQDLSNSRGQAPGFGCIVAQPVTIEAITAYWKLSPILDEPLQFLRAMQDLDATFLNAQQAKK